MPKPKLAILLLTLALALVGAPAAWAVAVPASIPADCSVDVDGQLNAFFRDVADGSTVDFPSGGCYRTGLRVELKNKVGLRIHGNGSWIKSHTENTGTSDADRYAIQPTVLLSKSDDIIIDRLNVEGNFHLTGARSQQRVNGLETCGDGVVNAGDENCATSQTNSGYGIFGGSDIELKDLATEGTWGDGVQVSHSVIVDSVSMNEVPRNIRLTRLTIHKAARHCSAPTQVEGYWLTDSDLSDCWYGGFDAESDGSGDPIKDLHLLRNKWRGYFMFAVWVPVAYGTGTSTDIEVANNVFETRPDNYCNQTLLIGAYPANPDSFERVTINNNTFMERSGVGVQFDHVKVGSIQHNKDAGYAAAGCEYPAVSPFSRVTNSTGVTVADNNASAAGATLTPPAPPAPPPVAPPPPPPTGCGAPTIGAPTNVAAARLSATQARVSWTHPGAASYTVWVKHTAWDSYLAYSVDPSGSPRTLYSLDAAKSYTAYVTAKAADGTVSAASPTVPIPLP